MSRFRSFRLAPTVFLATMLVAAPTILAAQGGAPGQGPGMGQRGGGGGRGFDPVVLEGPPAPEDFVKLASLDDAQKTQYATLYQNLMSDTKPQRDSLSQMRESMRAARERGERPDMSAMRGAGSDLRQSLQQKQDAFDSALKDFLSADQLKKYDAWKDQKRQEARQRFGRRGPS
jgi:hypothetical protein